MTGSTEGVRARRRRRSLGRIAGLLLTVAALVVGPTMIATAASSAVAPRTALSYRPSPVANLSGAVSAETPGDTVTFSPNNVTGIMLTTVVGATSVRAIALSPSAAGFAVGTSDFATAGPGLWVDVAYDSGSCTYTSGSFVVHEAAYDPTTQNLTTFAATATGNCGVLDFRLASAKPFVGISAPILLDAGTVKLGYPTALTLPVRVRGDQGPVTFTTAAVAASSVYGVTMGSESDFTITADTCSGQTVASGGSCSLTVKATPTAANLRGARIVLGDTTALGSTGIEVRVTGTEDSTGTYYPLDAPVRFLDTRSNPPAIGPGLTRSLQITGQGGIPSGGVSAVVLNVTVPTAAAASYLAVFPSNGSPGTSSINFPAGWTGANMVTVPVGPDGAIKIYNSVGANHAVVDVLGWYASDDRARTQFVGVTGQQFDTFSSPVRAFDSRQGFGAMGDGEGVRLTRDFGVVNNPKVWAFAATVTAVGGTSYGYFTAFSGDYRGDPGTSTVNYSAGKDVPNMAIIPVMHQSDGRVSFVVANHSPGLTHLVVDLVGVYFKDDTYGLRFRPLPPDRVLDTRNGTGAPGGALGPLSTRSVFADSRFAGIDTYALVTNLTGVQPSEMTFETVWDGVAGRPAASNLNLAAGEIRAVAAVAPLRAGNNFSIFNAAGSTHLVMDVTGSFEQYPPASAYAAAAAMTGRNPTGGDAPGAGAPSGATASPRHLPSDSWINESVAGGSVRE